MGFSVLPHSMAAIWKVLSTACCDNHQPPVLANFYRTKLLCQCGLGHRYSVCQSVCLSQACFVTKQKNILPIWVITLVFWHQQRLGMMSPSTLYLRLKWPAHVEKCWLWPISAYNVSTTRASKECSIIVNRKSITRFPTSYRWTAYVNSPKRWLNKRIYRF